jgi:hypothetical protein
MNANSGIPKKKKERSLHLGVMCHFWLRIGTAGHRLAHGLFRCWEYTMTTLGEKPDYLFIARFNLSSRVPRCSAYLFYDYHRSRNSSSR